MKLRQELGPLDFPGQKKKKKGPILSNILKVQRLNTGFSVGIKF